MTFKNIFKPASVGTFASSLVLTGLLSSSALAAIQGAVGLTSTGSIDINARVEPLILIANLDDIDLGAFDATNPNLQLTGGDSFCVATNSTPNYTLTARGSGANNQFQLAGVGTDPDADILDYSVDFSDGAGGTFTLDPGVTVNASGASLGFSSCTTGSFDNQRVDVTVPTLELINANAGNFSGTLTLTVSPI